MAMESVGAGPVSVCCAEFRCGSRVGGSCMLRRRSCSNRSPAGVIGEPAPPGRGAVERRPHQRQAGVLAGQPADHLDPAARLAEGAFDEVGVAHPGPVLARKPQVDGQRVAVVEQAAHRRRIRVAPACGERVRSWLEPWPPRPGRAGHPRAARRSPSSRPSPRPERFSAPWPRRFWRDGSGSVVATPRPWCARRRRSARPRRR